MQRKADRHRVPHLLPARGLCTVPHNDIRLSLTTFTSVFRPRTFALLCWLPYSYLSPYIHHVVLKGLKPNKRYTYRVAGRNGTLSAKTYAFTTLP